MNDEVKSNRIRFWLVEDREKVALIEADTLPRPGDIVEYYTPNGVPYTGRVEQIVHKMDGPGKGAVPVGMMAHVHVVRTS